MTSQIQQEQEQGENSWNKDMNRLYSTLKDAGKEPLILTDLNLSDAILTGTSLRNADLRQSNFENAHLERADLRNAKLAGAKLLGADLRGARLNNADLTCANLGHAKLAGAKLGGVDLTKANLKYADLTDTVLDNTNVTGTKLAGVTLTNAVFSITDGPPASYVAGIKGLATVTFPQDGETGLLQIQDLLRKSGLRDLERDATHALEHWRARHLLCEEYKETSTEKKQEDEETEAERKVQNERHDYDQCTLRTIWNGFYNETAREITDQSQASPHFRG